MGFGVEANQIVVVSLSFKSNWWWRAIANAPSLFAGEVEIHHFNLPSELMASVTAMKRRLTCFANGWFLYRLRDVS